MNIPVVPITADNTASAVDALRELWPHYALEEMVRVIDQQLRPNGYQLVGIFGDDSPVAAAVLGYRIQHSLWLGQSLYIVDIATLPKWRAWAAAPCTWTPASAGSGRRRIACTCAITTRSVATISLRGLRGSSHALEDAAL